MSEGNKPEKEFRSGTVTATIWANLVKKDDREFTVLNTEVARSYKKEDKYEKTNNYSPQDLSRLRVVVEEALKYVMLQKEKEENE